MTVPTDHGRERPKSVLVIAALIRAFGKRTFGEDDFRQSAAAHGVDDANGLLAECVADGILDRVGATRFSFAPPPAGLTGCRAAPFVKWAGGKRSLLTVLCKHAPASFGRYFEPFVGGGALFWSVRPRFAILADANDRLVRTYRAVRDSLPAVIELLRTYPNDRDFFERMRNAEVDGRTDAEVAAWLIYLNRTCFNGLYRVNKAGRFSVPFGAYSAPRILDVAGLRACSAALQGASVLHGDFARSVASATTDDFVYFDPPYAPLSASAGFVQYTAKGFALDDQVRLRDCAVDLVKRGVYVLVSNSSTPLVRSLYSDADLFTLHEFSSARRIGAAATSRTPITELLVIGTARPLLGA